MDPRIFNLTESRIAERHAEAAAERLANQARRPARQWLRGISRMFHRPVMQDKAPTAV